MRSTSTQERLLAAADELFYSEGVQTVGVDRIAKRAGASKKSLYTVFGSKEALVLAYLGARRTAIEAAITQGLSRFGTPRERLLGIFEVQGDVFATPGYNGCPFLAASAEAAPGSLVERAHADYRTWVRALFTELAAEAGVPDHETVGRELHLLYDAASVAASADHDPSAATVARTAAAAILASSGRA
ncbi:TetR/AcrR family transcriptional regulator [Streptomyces sp. SID13031]|uniref:TetR/AcrR family transcriptional regulator n=1 Tax=Streptomyces sp. SID13031 TaxID=2706046 RepID=UPI0013CB3D26|nr:TetR/AcrR family transcriptional regulator [Streptomyces sp. SID13031]NEA37311.1 TetR/AcrR family transcriptional regulator [Streptomyces sp. SID13031]